MLKQMELFKLRLSILMREMHHPKINHLLHNKTGEYTLTIIRTQSVILSKLLIFKMVKIITEIEATKM